MEASNDRNYSWDEALWMINKGYKMRLPEWKGYWFKYKGENGVEKESPIFAMTKDGNVEPAWENDYYAGRNDWQIAYGLGFDWALSALKAGKYVRRKGWNGNGMYIFYNDGRRNGINEKAIENGIIDKPLEVSPFLIMKTADNKLSVGWRPTNLDMFSDDWELAEVKAVAPPAYNPDEVHLDRKETTSEWVKRMLKEGKKMRRSWQNGYLFSYDGVMASMVTEEGKTLTAFKPIDELVVSEQDEWEEAAAFRMLI